MNAREQIRQEWAKLEQDYRQQIADELTLDQLNVLVLHLAGCSQQRIADMLATNRRTVRDRLKAGLDVMAQLGRRDAT